MKSSLGKKCIQIAVFVSLILNFSFVQANECSGTEQFNNRGIESVSFKRNTNGEILVQSNTYLSVKKSDIKGVNLSFDMHVYVNGVLFDIVSEDVVTESAITCAVTCAGKCPSIFGDGVCKSCGCDYNSSLTAAIPGVSDGDTVSVELVAARGGERDTLTKDDVRKTVFRTSMLN